MIWLTRNPGSSLHFVSADLSNTLLQRLLPTHFSITVATVYQSITGFIDSRAALARWLQEVACLRSVYVPLASQRRVPAPACAAGACSTSLCWWHPSKGAKKPRARVKAWRHVEDQSKRGSSKHVLKSGAQNSPQTWIKAQNSRLAGKPEVQRSPNCASKTEAFVERNFTWFAKLKFLIRFFGPCWAFIYNNHWLWLNWKFLIFYFLSSELNICSDKLQEKNSFSFSKMNTYLIANIIVAAVQEKTFLADVERFKLLWCPAPGQAWAVRGRPRPIACIGQLQVLPSDCSAKKNTVMPGQQWSNWIFPSCWPDFFHSNFNWIF